MLTGEEIKRLILEKELIKNYVDLDVQIQPNGVDLTVGKIEILESMTPGIIDFTGRTFPRRRIVKWPRDDFVELSLEDYYLGWTNEIVNMPSNMIGILKARTSTFTMGLAIFTGIVDAGFRGHIRFGMRAYNPIRIIKDARLLHMVVARLPRETIEYSGIWKEGYQP